MPDQDTFQGATPTPETAQGAPQEALQAAPMSASTPAGVSAETDPLEGVPVDFFEQHAHLKHGGAGTNAFYKNRGAGREWHNQAVGDDSLGAGVAEAMVEQRALAGTAIEADGRTFAHVNSMPEDPVLLAQLSPTNRRARLKSMTARHEVLARLVATGASDAELCRVVGRYSQTRLSSIRNSPRFIMRVQQIQEQYFGKGVEGRFKRIALKAVDTAEALLEHPAASGDLKFKVAKDFMDRAYGKAKETVEVKSNTVTDLFEALDRFKRGEIAAPGALAALMGQAPTTNAIDSWIDSQVPADTGIGVTTPTREAGNG